MVDTSPIDWQNNDALDDDDMDTFDLPPVTPSFFVNDKASQPQPSVNVSLPMDIDIVKWFRSQGPGWEKRMVAALRLYMDAHKDQKHV